MRLLVSVRDADEARAALLGGAEIIDAKEPSRGALGAVGSATLRAIRSAVGGTRPLSAALGDAAELTAIEDATRAAAELGLTYVKVGFRAVRDAERAAELLAAAVRGASAARTGTEVVAVAYADAERVASLSPRAIIDIAVSAGARGVLLDTACKAGGGLLALMEPAAIARWVHAAHEASLVVALAGKLSAGDITITSGLGADIIGVRGAACEGGREGCIATARVRALVAACQCAAPSAACSAMRS